MGDGGGGGGGCATGLGGATASIRIPDRRRDDVLLLLLLLAKRTDGARKPAAMGPVARQLVYGAALTLSRRRRARPRPPQGLRRMMLLPLMVPVVIDRKSRPGRLWRLLLLKTLLLWCERERLVVGGGGFQLMQQGGCIRGQRAPASQSARRQPMGMMR